MREINKKLDYNIESKKNRELVSKYQILKHSTVALEEKRFIVFFF